MAVASIVLSWVGGVLPHFAGRDFLLREILQPALPNVSLPVGSESDFVSVVPHLFRALVVALAAVLLAEPGKYRLAREGPKLFTLTLIYQAVLFLDLFRWYAYDWFLYTLHFIGLVDLSANPVFIKTWCTFGAPWVSFVAMSLLLLGAMRRSRSAGTRPSA